MKVLIGCEESQVVCKAFRDRGHEAFSCDIQETRGNSEWHHQGDIIEYLESKPDQYFDLLILHPDCTKLALSGNRWYGKGTAGHEERLNATQWTISLWNLAKAKGKAVVLENPTSIIFPILKKEGARVQYIQPWQFGHGETKKTGLALHNVDELEPTNIVQGREQRIWKMGPSSTRKRDRSETYQGIADAMAEQWGEGNV